MEPKLNRCNKQFSIACIVFLVGLVAHTVIYQNQYGYHLGKFENNSTNEQLNVVLQHKLVAMHFGRCLQEPLTKLLFQFQEAFHALYKFFEQLLSFKCPFIRALILGMLCLPILNCFLVFVYFVKLKTNKGITLKADQNLQVVETAPKPPPRCKRGLKKKTQTSGKFFLESTEDYPLQKDTLAATETTALNNILSKATDSTINSSVIVAKPPTELDEENNAAYLELQCQLKQVLASLQQPLSQSLFEMSKPQILRTEMPEQIKWDITKRTSSTSTSTSIKICTLKAKAQKSKRKRSIRMMHAIIRSLTKAFKSTETEQTFKSYCYGAEVPVHTDLIMPMNGNSM